MRLTRRWGLAGVHSIARGRRRFGSDGRATLAAHPDPVAQLPVIGPGGLSPGRQVRLGDSHVDRLVLAWAPRTANWHCPHGSARDLGSSIGNGRTQRSRMQSAGNPCVLASYASMQDDKLRLMSSMSPEPRDSQITIRIPARVRDAIEQEAERDHRSISDVICMMLNHRYPVPVDDAPSRGATERVPTRRRGKSGAKSEVKSG